MCYSIPGTKRAPLPLPTNVNVAIEFEVGDYVRIKGSQTEGQVTDCVLDRGRVWYGVKVDGVEQTVGQEQLEHADEVEAEAARHSGNCWHNWVLYTGLQEQFRHCKYCGIKESEAIKQFSTGVFLDEVTEWPEGVVD